MAHTSYPQSYYAASANPVPQRPALQGETETDVCIIGAGYTGLWTAYYLKKADPSMNIVVLEREFAGFGASGICFGETGVLSTREMRKSAIRFLSRRITWKRLP